LPTDAPRPAIQTFVGQTQEIQIPLAIAQQLKQFSQQSEVTLFMTLLTAFGVLLSRYSSAEDVAIGSPIANRQYPEIEQMFALQNVPNSDLELPDLHVRTIEVEGKTAKFDLTLSIRETAQGLRGVWEYNTDLFTAATIRRMAGHLETLLVGMLADPTQPIGQLPLLTVAESQQLLVDWNDTQVSHTHPHPIHQLFAAQIAIDNCQNPKSAERSLSIVRC
jgi:non-ribosomal peptide synthetase component F